LHRLNPSLHACRGRHDIDTTISLARRWTYCCIAHYIDKFIAACNENIATISKHEGNGHKIATIIFTLKLIIQLPLHVQLMLELQQANVVILFLYDNNNHDNNKLMMMIIIAKMTVNDRMSSNLGKYTLQY
jgi:hypothetical protein